MKFGAHIFLWIQRWETRHCDLFFKARDLGLDGLEIAVGDDVEWASGRVRAAAENSGVEVVLSPGGAWPSEMDLSTVSDTWGRTAMDWHTRWIQEAGECGALAYTGALYGHPGNVLRGLPEPDLIPRTADRLHKLAETAAKYGVEIVLEPMSHFRTHVVNTPEQAMKLVRLAGHPNLKILLDTYHLVTEIRDYGLAVQQTQPFLWGIHACENDRGVPGGGLVPWRNLFESLHTNNFDGWMIMESYNSRDEEFAFSRGMFHNVCPDGDRFVRQGLRFLQTSIASAAPPE